MRDTKNGVARLRWWAPIALAVLHLSIASGVGAQEVLTLDAEQVACGVFIHQGWSYHGDDDPAWAGPETDDSTWPVVSSAFFEPDDLPGGWQGIGWFRLRFRLDPQIAEGHLGLYINQAGASEWYLDGERVARFGTVGGGPEEETPVFPRNLAGQEPQDDITVVVVRTREETF